MSAAVEFRIGTASWTDPSLVNSDLFYPPSVRSAEERLRFYAEQFNTVEVDSTYYALPAERNAKLWAERTPEGFLFNIKPFALMTQHPAEISRLPKELREMLPPGQLAQRRLPGRRARSSTWRSRCSGARWRRSKMRANLE